MYFSNEANFSKMVNLIGSAYRGKKEIDAVMVLGVIRCGLYSNDETTAKLSIEIL